jgi:simple sugar transport system ATP-binding protein
VERTRRKLGEQLGWPVDATARVESLSVGERQRVEIIKALFAASSGNSPHETSTQSARLLLLDEPTANLTPGEASELLMSCAACARRAAAWFSCRTN